MERDTVAGVVPDAQTTTWRRFDREASPALLTFVEDAGPIAKCCNKSSVLDVKSSQLSSCFRSVPARY